MPGSGASLTSAWKTTFTRPHERRLVAMSLIDSIGTGLYIAGSVIYFTLAVGLSPAQVGLGLSIASVVGLAGVIPAGWAAQRFGTWRVLVVFDLWRMAGFTSYIFIHSFAWFLVVVSLLAIPEQSVSPLMQHLVEQVVGRADRTVMMGKVRALYNIGFTVGAPLSGLAVKFGTTTGYDAIMLGDAATYALAAVILVRLARPVGSRFSTRRASGGPGGRPPGRQQPRSSDLDRPGHKDDGEKDAPVTPRRFSLGALRDGRYMGTAGINGIMSLHMTILSVAIPLWVTMHTSVPRYLVGPLLLINTALVIPLQVPISSFATSVARSIGLMRIAGFTLSACCLLLAMAAWLPVVPAVIMLAAAIAFLTAGEMTQSASGWTLAYELAPTRARAECLTTFGLGTSAQFVVGPLLLTDAIIAHGAAGWIGLSIAFLLISMTLAVVVRPARPAPGSVVEPPP